MTAVYSSIVLTGGHYWNHLRFSIDNFSFISLFWAFYHFCIVYCASNLCVTRRWECMFFFICIFDGIVLNVNVRNTHSYCLSYLNDFVVLVIVFSADAVGNKPSLYDHYSKSLYITLFYDISTIHKGQPLNNIPNEKTSRY